MERPKSGADGRRRRGRTFEWARPGHGRPEAPSKTLTSSSCDRNFRRGRGREGRTHPLPRPHSRPRPTPDDLARHLAGQIASKKPPKPRYRLRDSVLVGRLIAGAMALGICAAILAAILVGANWWTDRSTAAEVLATEVAVSGVRDHPGFDTTSADPAGIHVVGLPDGFRLAGALLVPASSPLPQLPAPTTTSPVAAGGPTTTARQVPSSSATPSTAVPTTASQAQPTTSAPTTTTPQATTTAPSTTTTVAGTTTTIPATTTTVPDTTTTCAGNSGGGNGTGPCGP